MNNPKPSIRVKVDVTNPGQFFACCGLLELADRLWPGAEGWFEETVFLLHVPRETPHSLLKAIAACKVTNTMGSSQVQRRNELSLMSKKERVAQKLEEEKKVLDRLWREKPVVFHSPFELQVNWFLDDYSGGSKFKTWAGQQSIINIAQAMHGSIAKGDWSDLECDNWLGHRSDADDVPFSFDSNLGSQSSSLDVGYSLDPLGIPIRTRPLIELGAFIGLQRFRPFQVGEKNLYRYRTWNQPLTVHVASIAACTFLNLPESVDYEFRLLYRTKYLKSFLPATLIGASS